MDEAGAKALSVEIGGLPSEHVACGTYQPAGEWADMHAEIAACFERVRSWMRGRGHETRTLTVGAITGRMESYECRVRVPASVKAGSDWGHGEGSAQRTTCRPLDEEGTKVIGESIGRYYQDYVPHHGLRVDAARPTCEIYSEESMGFCVPLL